MRRLQTAVEPNVKHTVTMDIEKLISLIDENTTYGAVGYSEAELASIERLYDIELSNPFRLFLSHSGRSSGCGLNPKGYFRFYLYDCKVVRNNLLQNVQLVEDITAIAFEEMKIEKQYDLKKHRFSKYIFGKPFILTTTCETQELFILTTENGGYNVYQFDTNEDEIFDSGLKLPDYLASLMSFDKDQPFKEAWIGELLIP